MGILQERADQLAADKRGRRVQKCTQFIITCWEAHYTGVDVPYLDRDMLRTLTGERTVLGVMTEAELDEAYTEAEALVYYEMFETSDIDLDGSDLDGSDLEPNELDYYEGACSWDSVPV